MVTCEQDRANRKPHVLVRLGGRSRRETEADALVRSIRSAAERAWTATIAFLLQLVARSASLKKHMAVLKRVQVQSLQNAPSLYAACAVVHRRLPAH